MTKTPLSSKALKRIHRAAIDFPMGPVLDRYRQEYGVSKDDARVHEREMKRYFILSARHPDRPYGMKGPIDNLWHTFLLFTERYQAFSEALLGPKGFLHHHPCTTAKGAAYPITYDGFWYDYAETFGETPPDMVWPAPEGPRRGWDQIMAEVDAFRRANPMPDDETAAGRRVGWIAGIFGIGWLWHAGYGNASEADGSGISDTHSGGMGDGIDGGFDGGGGGCGGGGCGGGV